MTTHMDWRALDRYLAGEPSDDERRNVESWLQGNPRAAAGVRGLKGDGIEWEPPVPATSHAEAAFARVLERATQGVGVDDEPGKNRRRHRHAWRMVLIAAVAAYVCACTRDAAPTPPPPPPSVVRLEIVGEEVGLAFTGQKFPLRARLVYSNSTLEDVTAQAGWSSRQPSVADVSSNGEVTAVADGTAEIGASYEGRTASRTITVGLAYASGWVLVGPVRDAGVTDRGVADVLVDPRNSNRLIVSADSGLFTSRDRGASWSRQYAVVRNGRGPLARDPSNPDRVFHAAGFTLRASVDGGSSWHFVKQFDDWIRSVEVSHRDGRTIYVGTQGPSNAGIVKSPDGGATWESHAFGFPVTGITQFIPWDIAEDPVDGTLYVPTELHDHPAPYRPPFFRSTDGGGTWQDISGGRFWHGLRVLVHPTTRHVYFLTEGAGLYRSRDRGESWSRIGTANFAMELIMDPSNPARLFGGEVVFGNRRGGVFVSMDDGVTFAPFGLEGRTCAGLALSSDGKLLFAACYGSGLYMRVVP
jgi:photosystem II stability/assembly factor-like uncharacterized protein